MELMKIVITAFFLHGGLVPLGQFPIGDGHTCYFWPRGFGCLGFFVPRESCVLALPGK